MCTVESSNLDGRLVYLISTINFLCVARWLRTLFGIEAAILLKSSPYWASKCRKRSNLDLVHSIKVHVELYVPLSSSDHVLFEPVGFLCMEGPAWSGNFDDDRASSIGSVSGKSGRTGVWRGVIETGVEPVGVDAAGLRGFLTRLDLGSTSW